MRPGPKGCNPGAAAPVDATIASAPGGAAAAGFVDGQIRQAAPSRASSGGAWDYRPAGEAAQYSSVGITIRVPGLYLIECEWPWAGNSTGRRAVKVTKNSSVVGGAILSTATNANAWLTTPR